MILAHPDDEVLFGWPIFQDPSVSKELLMIVSDENNQERKWASERKKVLLDICRTYDVPVTCWNYDSSFYSKLNARNGELKAFYEKVGRELEIRKYDYVFTHNYHGEYGHLDHRLIFDTVFKYSKKPLLITDIIQRNVWDPFTNITEREKRLFYREKIQDCRLDEKMYSFCKEYYENNPYGQNCWTWKEPVVKSCGLYLLE